MMSSPNSSEVITGAKTKAPTRTPVTTPTNNPTANALHHVDKTRAPMTTAISPISSAPISAPVVGSLMPSMGGPSQKNINSTKEPNTAPAKMPANERHISELTELLSSIIELRLLGYRPIKRHRPLFGQDPTPYRSLAGLVQISSAA